MSEHIYYTILIALLMTALGFEIAIYLQQLGVIPYSSSQGGRRNLLPFFYVRCNIQKKINSNPNPNILHIGGRGRPEPEPEPEPRTDPVFFMAAFMDR